MARRPIPVIDLFAGPGGLAEGFASVRSEHGTPVFHVALSIEKDEAAHRTLQLRSFFRAFGSRKPDAYYDYLRGVLNREQLFSDTRFRSEAEQARREAWHLTLGEQTRALVSARVKSEIAGHDTWVLIGGPPCQAYSLIGRSRMRSTHPAFERDERHFLYKEYLRLIVDHKPPVFIMENVKGLLSSTIGRSRILDQILDDLSNPAGSLRYRIVPLAEERDLFGLDPRRYIICSELFGIPQARHRVILCGIREDVRGTPPPLTPVSSELSVSEAISDLPAVRSSLSRTSDSHTEWCAALHEGARLVSREGGSDLTDVARAMLAAARRAREVTSTGGKYVLLERTAISSNKPTLHTYVDWIRDERMDGVTGHQTRSHMREDLYRYLFASSYASLYDTSPTLEEFPDLLLPRHRNAWGGKGVFHFADRFRVQVANEPATTVTSHISKDGHYFIHPDPWQCRSLTVREAARLQSFPDNYHFEGSRTQQLQQVGNAVPPLLAYQIARSIAVLLRGVPNVRETTEGMTSVSRHREGGVVV